MKKLLVASMQLPWPADNGQKVATLSDLASLSRRFAVDVVSCIDPINEPKVAEALASLSRHLPTVRFLPPVPHNVLRGAFFRDKVVTFIRGLLRVEPFTVTKYRNNEYLAAVGALLEAQEYDALYLESLSTTWLIEALPSGLRRPRLTIYRAFDAFFETSASYSKQLSLGPTAIAAWLDSLVSHRYERRVWGKVDVILTVTQRLLQQILSEAPAVANRVHHFPVAVDDIPVGMRSQPRQPRVLYAGTAHYPPNLLGLKWFLKECWPLILKRHPDAVFDVVGRGSDLLGPQPESVVLRGYVQDLDSVYHAASVFVVPLFSGSGVRIKILDAMRQGVPVVSTFVGYAGLEVAPGRNILTSDEPEQFADHVCALLSDDGAAARLSEAGRAFIRDQHSRAAADRVVSEMAT